MKKISIFLIVAMTITLVAGCQNKADEETVQKPVIVENNDGTFMVSENDSIINVPDVESGNAEEAGSLNIKISVPNENATDFDVSEESTDIKKSGDEDADKMTAIIKALKDKNVLSNKVKTPTLKIKENKADVDFSGEFLEFVRTQGSSGEYYIIGAVVNSIIENFDVEKVKITCDGNTLETGHDVYDKYLQTMKGR